MADINTTRRGLLGAMAGAPLAATLAGMPVAALAAPGTYELAVREYKRVRAIEIYQAKHGALRAAYNLHERRRAAFEAKYTDPSMASVEDREAWKAHYNEMCAAENDHSDRYGDPRWDAAKAIYDVPAPSITAILEKVDIANDEGDDAQILDFVMADLRRLAAH